MLRAYISRLLELAEKDDRVLHLLADSGESFDRIFRMNFPDRVLNFGIAEQNMLGAAAGLALSGWKPFVFAQGAFLTYRALEFLRNDICMQNANVKIVGTGSGLALSSLGPSHHTTEDIAILSVLPHLTIYSPASPAQVIHCMNAAYEQNGPVYIRLGMSEEEPGDGLESFSASGIDLMYKSGVQEKKPAVTVFSTGSIVKNVVCVAKELEEKRICSVSVRHICKIKPLDEAAVTEACRGADKVFTVEEHSTTGGLGSLVSQALMRHKCPIECCPIGIENGFAVGYGTYDEVRRANGLDAVSIMEKIEKAIEMQQETEV